tara:strand:+ start:55 stop:1044 length:990 start_codon:yes stop_codon:yes gene_type:complete
MATIPAILPSNIDVSKITFKDVQKSKDIKGFQSCLIQYEKNPLCIQTPVSIIPYPPKTQKEFKELNGDNNDDENSNDNKMDLTISFGNDYQSNPKMLSFYNKLEEIQDYIVNTAVSKKTEWFGDSDEYNQDDSVVKIIFNTKLTKLFKKSKKSDTQYPPTIKFKIPFNPKTQSYKTDFFDMESNEALDINEIRSVMGGCKCICIVRMTKLWFAGGKFGISLDLISCKVKLNNTINKPMFQYDSDCDKESPVEDDVEAVSKKLKNTPIDDSEDDEDNEEDVKEDKDVSKITKVLKKEVDIEDPEEEEAEEEEDEELPPPPAKKTPAKKKK